MTVIFMENCFQILEKNKILGLKKSMVAGPLRINSGEKEPFFFFYGLLVLTLQNLAYQNFPAF